MTEPYPDRQKIEDDIRKLEILKNNGAMPADLADASIAALKEKLAAYQAKLDGPGAISQGQNAQAVGADGILIDGDLEGVFIKGDGNEVNVGTGPRARKGSLREAYLSYILSLTSPLALSGVVRQSASEAETRMNLSAVYTALLTISYEVDLDRIKPSAVRRLSVVEQINLHNKIVLLGDPGSGKSTFVNFLALCMVGQALGREDANLSVLIKKLPVDESQRSTQEGNEQKTQPWDHGTLLPVRIILRDFAVRGLPESGRPVSAEHIWKFIGEELEGAALEEYIPLLKKELRDQGGLLLFDGLDEVPEAESRREQIKQAIESFVSSFPRCRFVVTSRTYAYQNQGWKLSGFDEATLAPFTNAQINQFVEHWYAHIARVHKQNEQDAKGKAELLKRAIRSNERLLALAERPLLLTLMASLHAWRGGTLPDKREELYADAVDLLLDWWESQRVVRDGKGNVLMIQPSLAEWLKVDRKKVRDLLNQIAYEAHAGQTEVTGTADVHESLLVTGLMNLSQNPDVKPGRLIEYLRDRADLLISRGVGVFTFPHRTFQEYLAACYLTDHNYPDAVAGLARKDPNRWREAALLAGAKAARGAADFALWALVDALSPEEETDKGDVPDWGVQIAGQAVVEIASVEKISGSNLGKVQRLRNRLLDVMQGDRLPPVERAQAGSNLAMMGDPRFDSNYMFLPKEPLLGLVQIPKGKFLMGSSPEVDQKASSNEQPQHELEIPYDYYLARYPVTVAQYNSFLEERGYKANDKYSLVRTPNHPIIRVSWYDALEYCNWLDQKLKGWAANMEREVRSQDQLAFWQGLADGRLCVMLPTEAEWEKAARGTDGKIFPWGNEFDSNKANVFESGIGMTSTVGCFPSGASPYEIMDMSGNVREWTRSVLKEYPYASSDEGEDIRLTERRVLRGGSFLHKKEFVRCAFRERISPDSRNPSFGFRVVVSPLLS